jgi:hypothetical protein
MKAGSHVPAFFISGRFPNQTVRFGTDWPVPCYGIGLTEGVRVSSELEGLSPEERAKRYLARAEEARRMASVYTDPQMVESLERMIIDWEFLAAHTLKQPT